MNCIVVVFGSLAAVSGYLVGAVSSTRLVARIHPTHPDVNSIEIPIEADGKKISIPVQVSSPTVLRFKVGARWGILATLLDVIKAALPVLFWKMAFPEQPYLFITAIAVSLGNNWPIYYGFNGGYGTSVFYGSLLIINWRGLLFNIGASMVFSGILGKSKLGYIIPDILGKIALILWAIFYVHSPWLTLYTCIVLVFYLIRFFANAIYLKRAVQSYPAERESQAQ
jgi:acyl phosphate:glycerol-3-phosphate acyltransferase